MEACLAGRSGRPAANSRRDRRSYEEAGVRR